MYKLNKIGEITPPCLTQFLVILSCKAVKKAISKRKSELMEQRVIDCEGDQKKLFSLIYSLLDSEKNTVLPEYTSSFTLASTINIFLYR